jgi:prepilin-type N-terminal cleavage/methylation domain-containing protein
MTRNGVTLLEVLVVLALVSLLAVGGTFALERTRGERQLIEAQQVIASELMKARRNAQQYGRVVPLEWTPRSFQGAVLPEGVELATASSPARYEDAEFEPYGGFAWQLRGQDGRAAIVATVGVTGKPRAVPIQ